MIRFPSTTALLPGLVFLSLSAPVGAVAGGRGTMPLERLLPGGAPKRATGVLAQPRQVPFPCVLGTGPLRSPLPGAGRRYDEILEGKRMSGPDTVRVAIFRVDWDEDSAGDLTTAPGGRFLLEPDENWPYPVDFPPHDSTYFNTQMEVLGTYYSKQSYGRAVVEWKIYPAGPSSTYRLGDTDDYLPEGDPGSWDLIERSDLLVKFCTDVIVHVDTIDPSVDFSSFDGYLIFHAGPDVQTDINGDSPGDIPSFFLSLGDSDLVYVDQDSDSFAVTGVTCLPEYDSQDGFTFGLNGVLAHEFGHQLGLPDLYNTDTFWPAVGQWDLMDSGGLVSISSGDTFLGGIIPASLSAWSKLYLGWIDPVIVTGPQALAIACATHPDPPAKSVRYALVPLNSSEYFLVENRFGLAPVDQFAARVDSLNSVVLGPVTNDSLREPTYDYDFALPGWGTLIWHVNERNINPLRVALNNVNVDFNDRGLELEEADGIKDLGNPFSAYWDGSPYDPFFEGSADRFGPSTAPNTDLSDGGRSFVEFSKISAADSVMTVQIDMAGSVEGFPVAMTGDSTIIAPAGLLPASSGGLLAVWISFDSAGTLISGVTSVRGGDDGKPPVVTRSALPGLVAVFPAGGEFRVDLPGKEAVTFLDDGTVVRIGDDLPGLWKALGSIGPDTLRADPVAVDIDGDGADEVITATADSLTAWSVAGDTLSRRMSIPLPGRPVSNLAAPWGANGEVRVVTDGGAMARLSFGPALGGVDIVATIPPVASARLIGGDIDRDGADNWFALDEATGTVYGFFEDAEPLDGYPVELGAAVTGEPFFADRDGDGFPELAVPAGHDLFLIERTGVILKDTPFEIPELLRDSTAALTGNGVSGIFTGTAGASPVMGDDSGRLWAWEKRDEIRDDWPLSTGAANGVLAAAPLIGDGESGLYALSGDGFLYAFRSTFDPDRVALWPGRAGGIRGRHFLASRRLDDPAPPSRGRADIADAFAYPNPARGGETAIRFELSREENVEMKAYDMAGGLVESRNVRGAFGSNEIVWNTVDLPSGVYYVRLAAGDEVEFIKVAIVR